MLQGKLLGKAVAVVDLKGDNNCAGGAQAPAFATSYQGSQLFVYHDVSAGGGGGVLAVSWHAWLAEGRGLAHPKRTSPRHTHAPSPSRAYPPPPPPPPHIKTTNAERRPKQTGQSIVKNFRKNVITPFFVRYARTQGKTLRADVFGDALDELLTKQLGATLTKLEPPKNLKIFTVPVTVARD